MNENWEKETEELMQYNINKLKAMGFNYLACMSFLDLLKGKIESNCKLVDAKTIKSGMLNVEHCVMCEESKPIKQIIEIKFPTEVVELITKEINALKEQVAELRKPKHINTYYRVIDKEQTLKDMLDFLGKFSEVSEAIDTARLAKDLKSLIQASSGITSK